MNYSLSEIVLRCGRPKPQEQLRMLGLWLNEGDTAFTPGGRFTGPGYFVYQITHRGMSCTRISLS